MIPLRLSLRNFMCYRGNVPPVNFESFHVACLSGGNGHGKSALLDAMTWALWGKSRARDDDDLVSQGQSEMEVDFEFMVDGKSLRVIRKHEKAGVRRTRQASLDLLIFGEEGFRSISGDGRQQTQAILTNLLHMDYETFTNSSFLVQGRANQFSLRQPAERKEILASILGLSHYDDLAESARQLSRTRRAEAEALALSISEMAAEVEKLGEYEVELKRVRESAARLEMEAREAESSLTVLRAERNALGMKQVSLEETRKRVHHFSLELMSRQKQVEARRDKVQYYQGLIEKRAAVEDGYKQFVAAASAAESWNQRLREHGQLREQIAGLEGEIARARSDVVGEAREWRARVQQERKRADELPVLEKELAELRILLTRVDKAEEEHNRTVWKTQEVNSELARLRAVAAGLARDRKAAQEKVNLLLQGHARCPLCETDLGDDGIRRLGEKLQQEVVTLTKAVVANDAEQKDVMKVQSTLALKVTELEKVLSRRATLGQRLGALEISVRGASEASTVADEHERKLRSVEAQLQAMQYAPEQQKSLERLGREIQRVAYNEDEHREARVLLQGLEAYSSAHVALEGADKLLPQLTEWLASSEEEVARLQQVIQRDTKELEALGRDLVALPEAETRLEQAVLQYEEAKQKLVDVRCMVGAVEERLRRCAELADVRAGKERSLRAVREEEMIYQDLGEAFGKKGVQVMLIERALPEVEEEASRLLGMMSDNRLSLRISTQEQKKSGKGTIETFDIMVADELGTRKYEMFSGGETFRIDLALRLALSRLLARRAGAPMRTLFIDEGFGTQDASGREKLVEAINSIQGEFDKIIVVTHIEELKDAFPVRLEVVKTGQGSVVTVS